MKKLLEINPPGATHRLGKRVVKNEGTDRKNQKEMKVPEKILKCIETIKKTKPFISPASK